MSEPIYQVAKDKELRKRGIPLNTIITPDNFQLLITQDSIREITNRVSKRIKSKFTVNQIEQLVSFITRLPQSLYYNKPLSEVQGKIAQGFIDRYVVANKIRDENKRTSVIELTHLDEVTDVPTVDDYQKKELKQFTRDENQWKYAAFADRRGNAVVDFERVEGNRSSPDGLPSGKRITSDELDKHIYKTLNLVKGVLDPEFINDILNRFSSTWSTFQSINMPHQVVPLDSRNRLLTHTSTTEYKWNIHTAGQPGHLGDLKIQDTLQQIMQMKLGSFWLPITPLVGSYYQKIRMLVKEFTSQSIQVTEFLTNNPSEPTVYYYHFEFNVTAQDGERIFLEPVKNTFTFRKPFAQVNTLTISFRTPFNLLVFAADRGVYTVTFGNPTLFTITSAATHGLSTGDLIYVLNLDTANTTINDTINREAGWIITVTTPATWTIPFDSSALVGSETDIDVYYGSKRVFFPIEFLDLEQ